MNMNFRHCVLCALTEKAAAEISLWEWPPPYDVYSFKGRPNGYLMDRSTWGNEQFCLLSGDSLETVNGQVACQPDQGALWVGWALAPRLCGQGLGALFVQKAVLELRRLKGHEGRIFLKVAASNQRAIRAYQKAGFHYRATEIDEVPYTGRPESFWIMQAGR